MSSMAIEATDLCVERGQARVLSDVTFSVAKGDVFALLGGNGAGKSTTLLTFLGFLAPASGEAKVLGQDVQADKKFVHQQSAYLPAAANLYPHLTARENLDYFLALAGVSQTPEDIEAALDHVS